MPQLRTSREPIIADRWEVCGDVPPLQASVVQLWRAHLSEAPHDSLRLAQLLLPHCEQQQAERYRHEATHRQYVLGRVLLRTVLASELKESPASIRFQYESRGKPALADTASDIQFNLSHSGDFVMLAVAKAMRLGIDVERHRTLTRRDQIADGILSPPERSRYRSLCESERQQAFFAVWTRKEAIIKASGEGMAFPLAELEVSLTPGDARLLRFKEVTGEKVPWHLCDINCPDGYTAALATSDSPAAIELRHWHFGLR